MPPFVRPLAYNSLKHFAYFITILIILLNVISVSLPIFFPWPGLGLGLEGIKEINNLISLRNLMEQLGGKQQQRREVPAVVTETVQQEPITNTVTKTHVVCIISQGEWPLTNTVTKTQVVRVFPQGEWRKQFNRNPSPTLSPRRNSCQFLMMQPHYQHYSPTHMTAPAHLQYCPCPPGGECILVRYLTLMPWNRQCCHE